MGIEIERKFLVHKEKWEIAAKGTGKLLIQGYLFASTEKSVRVRIAGSKAFITIKGSTTGATRAEFEYEIPLADAQQMLNTLAESKIEKTRYEIEHDHKVWEVDVFYGPNNGLIVAEIELPNENEPLTLPDWVATEVTDDVRYYNSNLATNPYCNWGSK
jgi:CYTH domain-containing protein